MRTKKNVGKFIIIFVLLFVFFSSNIYFYNDRAVLADTATVNGRILYGFETQNEVSNCNSRNSFGKIKLSQQHVTSGKKSAYIEVTGTGLEDEELHLVSQSYEMFSSNFFYLTTNANSEFTDATDISQYDTFVLDVYNASDRDTSINVVLQTNAGNKYAKLSGSFHELGRTVLPKGKLSHIEYDIAQYQYCSLDQVMAVYFVFDRIQVDEEPLRLYMDSISVMKKVDDFKVEFADRTDNLICGFEDKIEASSFYTESFGVALDSFPKCELSTKHVSQGNYSLKISLPASNYYCRCTQWNGSCHLYMNETFYMKGFDINEYARKHNKSTSDYYLVFDLWYEGEDSAINVYTETVRVQSGGFYEVKAKLDDDIPTGKFTIYFGLNEQRTFSTREYYIDNIRIVDKAEYGE